MRLWLHDQFDREESEGASEKSQYSRWLHDKTADKYMYILALNMFSFRVYVFWYTHISLSVRKVQFIREFN